MKTYKDMDERLDAIPFFQKIKYLDKDRQQAIRNSWSKHAFDYDPNSKCMDTLLLPEIHYWLRTLCMALDWLQAHEKKAEETDVGVPIEFDRCENAIQDMANAWFQLLTDIQHQIIEIQFADSLQEVSDMRVGCYSVDENMKPILDNPREE